MPIRVVTTVIATTAACALALSAVSLAARAATLDYDYFKAKVQPIFLMKRPGHSPCVVCHAEANNQLHLEKLDPGATTWNEEETHKNFDTVAKMINGVDDPLQAKILLHPLAPEAGGDAFHSGGRQFETKQDPLWKTIAAFATGATLKDDKQVAQHHHHHR